jgi:hypothetical protein
LINGTEFPASRRTRFSLREVRNLLQARRRAHLVLTPDRRAAGARSAAQANAQPAHITINA